MATYNGVQAAVIAAGNEPAVNLYGGRVRAICEEIDYAAQALGSVFNIGGLLPSNAVLLGILVNTDTSTGTTTVSFGTAASSALFAALQAFTATNVPTPVGKAANALASLGAQTQVIMTTAVGALPASGKMSVVLLYTVD